MTVEDIQWYVDYFKYLNYSDHNALPHVTHFKERSILITDCEPNQSLEDIEVTLASMKTQYADRGYRFHRQFGYLLPYESITGREWNPFKYFIYISAIPEAFSKKDSNVFTFLEGDYLCFSFRLRHMEELNINLIHEYFKNRPLPSYVIANEHEDNLSTYTYCPYELQFPLKPCNKPVRA